MRLQAIGLGFILCLIMLIWLNPHVKQFSLYLYKFSSELLSADICNGCHGSLIGRISSVKRKG
jgi:hypothetical protein